MSAQPTRLDRPATRRRAPTPSGTRAVDGAVRAPSPPPGDACADATTTKYTRPRWARAIADARPVGDPMTLRAMVANDMLAPGRELSATPRSRWPAYVATGVVTCLFAAGIAWHVLWVQQSAEPIMTPAPRLTLARETANAAPTAPLGSSIGRASARVEAPAPSAHPPAPARVLNPIAEAVLGSARTQPAARVSRADDDGAIAELIAELDHPATPAHAAAPRMAHARARARHRHARVAHAQRARRESLVD